MSNTILLTKTTAARNKDALSHHRVRGLYFLAVSFVVTIIVRFACIMKSGRYEINSTICLSKLIHSHTERQ